MLGKRLNAVLAACLVIAVCALALMVVRDLDRTTLDRASSAHALLRERAVSDWFATELAMVERLAAVPGPTIAPELRATSDARRRLDSLAAGTTERAALADLDERRRRLVAARDAVNLAERLGVEGDQRLRAGFALAAAARDYRDAAALFVAERRAESEQREFQRNAAQEARDDWLRLGLAGLVAGVALLGWRASAPGGAAPAARGATMRGRMPVMPAGDRGPGAERQTARVTPASADDFAGNLRSLHAAARGKADIIDVEAREPAEARSE